ncbi:P-loop containing nucleoside triphosphate hydrolase protein [Piedraia hortae CBS 480.64]|uniref:P-loop containing nucleoside triphosphate hydrolase protein n=1 Tax=Piedraia hortae CBS 480.64 TaxID=1314780 RepID=A0A6A7C678_9PEZI|nr:P-loop containing nucleoside triphosphate hydrolase protein [Piedraia hortae CBS 480.64]
MSTPLLVGISGPSCSGKTTLARLLRDVVPETTVLHEDDFYKTDADIPLKDGVSDWDCLEAIDLPALANALKHVKEKGSLPSNLMSKEDKNTVGKVAIDQKKVDALKKRAAAEHSQRRVCIVDGFLLYSEEMKTVRDLLDIKLFLPLEFATVKSRRERRSGYMTLEGFWEDPPNYVENIVWPNYARDHAFLFKDGNVEGELDEAKLKRLDIGARSTDDMTASLEWAYEIVAKALH